MKRMILNEQSKVRLTLNGGHQILDEATIPFQIAFDQSVVDAKPTHILVIDITKDVFYSDGERANFDAYGERTIFPLEPINYIQFKKPGIHHLIFILINGMSKTKKRECLQKSYGCYDSDFWFSSIENNSVVKGQVAYAEVLVEIPKELFSEKSETKFGKAIWNWVNKWYDLEPIDQCEYRKRAIIAFTIQPIVWIFGFFIRLIPVVFISTIVMLRSIIAIFFGYQPTRFIPKADVIFWEFLVLFQSGSTKELFTPSEWFGDVIYEYTHYVHQTDFYPYKMLVVKKMPRLHTHFALWEVIIYPFFLSSFLFEVAQYPLSLYGGMSWGFALGRLVILFFTTLAFSVLLRKTYTSFKGDDKWVNRFNGVEGRKIKDKIEKRIFCVLFGISLFSFMVWAIPNISWVSVLNFLVSVSFLSGLAIIISGTLSFVAYKFDWLPRLIKYFEKIEFFKSKLNSELPPVVDQRDLWLQKSFDLSKLPEKVDIKHAPPSSSSIHTFRVGFWALKAKVCKPFPK